MSTLEEQKVWNYNNLENIHRISERFLVIDSKSTS